MPTREVISYTERLRGYAECLETVLDSPGHVNIGAANFLTSEIKQALDDLDGYLPHANDIRPERRAEITRFPEDLEGDNDNGRDSK
jgi:hypothetical protein